MFEHVDAYGGDPILTLVEHFKQDPGRRRSISVLASITTIPGDSATEQHHTGKTAL